jgi:hypothetical protein
MAKKTKQPSADEKLLEEVKARFQRCQDFESEARNLWKADLRFANGDPENGWQWEDAMRRQRELDKRPCLTINKVKQHNRQITNEARQNKPSIRVYPVDGGADKKTAEIFNGIIRHIEQNSNADTAYDTASEHAVDAGLGYWRVVTDYANEDSFDQEIFIKRVKNPLNVYIDPDIQEADGSDARFGFVFEDIPKDEFEARYPDAEAITWPMESGGTDWLQKDTIRIAEYFKRSEKRDTLYEDGRKASEMTPEERDAYKASGMRSRPVKSCYFEWHLIAGGSQILERKEWLGRYLPIVRVVGDEVEVDGKIDRKGHTRQMKDAQRMYNYNSSASVEYGALQTKTPILAPIEAIEGYESYWDNANTANLPYLPFNHVDETGNPIPMPQRMTPPAPATLFLEGMRVASEEMKMASGQYDASMGAKSNETSGRAIMARQREGDVATFHFIDNVARAIKYTGKILVDLIPKIYDTERVIRILGEDGKPDEAQIKPDMQQAYAEVKHPLTGDVQEIYNPSVGRYDVVVAVGPSYSTKRQEAFQALTEMASRSPQLMSVAGDLIMKAADFPMADQLAERLEKTLPPNLQEQEGEEIPAQAKAQIEHLTQVVQQLDGAVQNMSAELEDKELKERELRVKEYDAETKRLQVVGAGMTPEQVQSIVLQTLAQVSATQMPEQETPAMEAAEPMQEPPPMEMMEQHEPAQAGFFTPADGTGAQ